jgi:hypothetical protein
MKEFEKFLTDLPKPAVEVPEFRDQLRRELRGGAARRGRLERWIDLLPRPGLGGALAGAMAALLLLFVLVPGIPVGLHAALAGDDDGLRPLTAVEPAETERLQRASLLEADQAFVESWTARQPAPVEVRSVASERTFTVRQFELSDGKRVLVFTELGSDRPRPEVKPAADPPQIY